MKPEDTRLFNSEELLNFLKWSTVYKIHEDFLNTIELENIGLSNLWAYVKEDGKGKFHCEITADVVAKEIKE